MLNQTEHTRAINFTSYVMMKIKQAVPADMFYAIVNNDIVINELLENYGYYHMYPASSVIELLAQREPLLLAYIHAETKNE